MSRTRVSGTGFGTTVDERRGELDSLARQRAEHVCEIGFGDDQPEMKRAVERCDRLRAALWQRTA